MKKVLVIDDEAELLSILSLHFHIMEIEHCTATRAHEGLRIIMTEKIDLVVCDIMMPDMTGTELFERCKDLKECPQFLFSSGLSDPPFKMPFPEKILGYFLKPYDMEELLETVRKNL